MIYSDGGEGLENTSKYIMYAVSVSRSWLIWNIQECDILIRTKC